MSVKEGARGALKRLGIEGTAMRARDRQVARRAIRNGAGGTGPDGLPVPPAELINLVAGPTPIDEFLAGGKLGHDVIHAALERNDISLDGATVLDFGVGCGRVARHWKDDPVKFHGSDYNPVLVEWCQANLPHVTAGTNQLEPPLPYKAETFDLIYALSVFTHLTEPQQLVWASELRRVTKPGGVVLFTTHGPTFPHADPQFRTPEIQERLAAGEFLIFEPGHAGRNHCAALHPRDWVEKHMLSGFELVEYAERGATMNGGQDIYLVRRV